MRVVWVVTLIAAVATYLVFAWATVDRRTDEVRIESLITDIETAVNKRDLSGTMRWVSKEYKDEDGLNRERLRMIVAQGFRVDKDYAAVGSIQELSVAGTHATAKLHALVTSESGEKLYDRYVILTLRQEPTRHALLFPAKAWRIVSVSNLALRDEL